MREKLIPLNDVVSLDIYLTQDGILLFTPDFGLTRNFRFPPLTLGCSLENAESKVSRFSGLTNKLVEMCRRHASYIRSFIFRYIVLFCLNGCNGRLYNCQLVDADQPRWHLHMSLLERFVIIIFYPKLDNE